MELLQGVLSNREDQLERLQAELHLLPSSADEHHAVTFSELLRNAAVLNLKLIRSEDEVLCLHLSGGENTSSDGRRIAQAERSRSLQTWALVSRIEVAIRSAGIFEFLSQGLSVAAKCNLLHLKLKGRTPYIIASVPSKH